MNKHFKPIHGSFMVLYLLTYAVGWIRDLNPIFYTIHPFLGFASFAVPLILYLRSENKKLIRRMISNNFSITGSPLLKTAKVSTLVIMAYYLVSVITGVVLNYGWYASKAAYDVLHVFHGSAKIIVPLAVLTHGLSRWRLKHR